MAKWLAGIVTAVLAGVLTWWLTEGLVRDRSISRIEPTPPVSSPVPKIAYFDASPQRITSGGSSILSWETTDADSVEIQPAIGKVASQGSRSLQPASSTRYEIVAINRYGTSTAEETVTVDPLEELIVRTSQESLSVRSGERATIYVTVMDQTDQIVSDALVSVEAGGEKFLESADTHYNSEARLHGPYSASGFTGSNGVYTTWWVCNPCASGYGMSVTA